MHGVGSLLASLETIQPFGNADSVLVVRDADSVPVVHEVHELDKIAVG